MSAGTRPRIFIQQRGVLDEDARSWERTHDQRYAAYCCAVKDNGTRTVQQYSLSKSAHAALTKNAFSPELYSQLHGNALQHELLQEVITGIEQLSSLNRPVHSSFQHAIYDHTLDTFDAARFTIEMGDCSHGAKLVDLASVFLDYCLVAMHGAGQGACKGALDVLEGTGQLIFHPIDTAKALSRVALKIAELAHDYLPCELIDEYSSMDDWERYSQHCEHVAKNWRDAACLVKQRWKETPTRDIIHQAAYMVGNVSANVMVGGACVGMMSKAARCAKIGVGAAFAMLSEMELAIANPGYLLIKKTGVVVETINGEKQSAGLIGLWTRANRMSEFLKWEKNGLMIRNNRFIITDHFMNSLKKSGRKDIMPNDIINALHEVPLVGDMQFSWKYVDPTTGVKVFVNEFNQLVGIQPGNFK